jgi:Protein of unknown function (DUF4012)
VFGAGLALVLPAREPLLVGRDRMLTGRERLVAGDAAGAAEAFAGAEDAFAEARDRLGNPLTRLASFAPLIGRTPDAVSSGAEAGVLVARAGGVLARAAEGLPGGIVSLAPRDGTIPIEPFRQLAGPVAEARSLVGRADSILDEAPRRFVPGPVAEAVSGFDHQTDEASRALTAAAAITRVMPAFLGQDGPRRYLVGAQNPAELRGTGGLVGSYSVLTVDQGLFDLGTFRNANTLQQIEADAVELPTAEYERNYGDYFTRGPWSNANMTPDVPTAATVLERLYEAATGDRVHGAILADPHAFSLLMSVSGPAEVPKTGITVDAGSVVDFVTNEAYSLFHVSSERKRVLGAVAGALRRPGDLFAVVANNAGGNKIDFYARRTVRYSVELFPDGSSAGTARVRLDNTAPASGQPRYVIGPYEFLEGDAAAGENLMLVSAYCGPGCRLERYLRNGQSEGVEVHQELGYPFVLSAVRIPSGETADLEYRWRDDGAWEGDEYGGSYRLSVHGQPTIRPTGLEIGIRVPDGMRIVRTSPGLLVEGDHVLWSGTTDQVATFEVEFSRKLFGIL